MKYLSADLSNKRVIITGAAGLLGSQYASVLAQNGASLELLDIESAGLGKVEQNIKRKNTEITVNSRCLDITSEAAVTEYVNHLVSTLTNLERLVLINNAAIDAKVGGVNGENLSRLENFSLQQWQKEIDVGLTGAMLLSKSLGLEMAKRQSGVILNVASDLGIIAPNQNLYQQKGIDAAEQNVKPVTYSVIKHGIIGLTKYLATYWAQSGVRCNAIAPGGVQTDQSQEFVNKVRDLIPMKRMACPDEYNDAMLFLVSEASQYMNGHVLVMDGGRTIW